MVTVAWVVLFLAVLGVMAYRNASIMLTAAAVGVYLLLVSYLGHVSHFALLLLWLLYAVIFLPLSIPVVRQRFLTQPILKKFRQLMPQMSDTEREALAAGTVGWSGEIFSGKPNWKTLLAMPKSTLSEEEQAFLDGPVETLCQMLDDWTISRQMQIPEKVMHYLSEQGFFGMIIPKEYGGKAFSATAHSQIIAKISGVSIAVATTVGVPNSLGPAELLLHYGTDAQRQHYLPRLAVGQDIPCFALTSPVAGSDASAIEDYGVVCDALFEGKQQLCIRLTWNKRYITLSPIATLLGLAFKLYDPEKLLGEKTYWGITCALIPTTTPGVVTGRRHYPLDSAFQNGPTQGKDVLIPLDWVIGGREQVGQGWRMLMECLAVGRSISLPSMVCGGAKRSALNSGAYARIRRQFNLYIGQFGGIETALADIAANALTIEATRLFTVSAIDQGEKPVVESAISKYHTTEMARCLSFAAMDLHGGKGICMGPNNYLAQSYIEVPVAITVEGANILTRSMIIFGQGAMRCHPYVFEELHAANLSDASAALRAFDKAIFAHAGYLLSNQCRALVMSLTAARFVKAPEGEMQRYYQQFQRFSAILALVSDVSMLLLGGGLKRLENLSARLGDLLSFIYMGSAVLKYHAEATATERTAEAPVVHWVCQDLLYRLQTALDEYCANFPVKWIAWVLRLHTLPLGRRLKRPSDRLARAVAAQLLSPSPFRKRLMKAVYASDANNNHVLHLEKVMEAVIAGESLLKKLSQARRDGTVQGKTFEEWVNDAAAQHLLTAAEADQLLSLNHSILSVTNVDDFAPNDAVFT